MKKTPAALPLDRREFTVGTVLAMLSGVAITISEGCGSSANPAAPVPAAPLTPVSGNVSLNHGHEAVVTGAQLTSPTAISLNIQGTATHPHTVTLTQAEVTSIAARTQVTISSTTEFAHNHTVTFN